MNCVRHPVPPVTATKVPTTAANRSKDACARDGLRSGHDAGAGRPEGHTTWSSTRTGGCARARDLLGGPAAGLRRAGPGGQLSGQRVADERERRRPTPARPTRTSTSRSSIRTTPETRPTDPGLLRWREPAEPESRIRSLQTGATMAGRSRGRRAHGLSRSSSIPGPTAPSHLPGVRRHDTVSAPPTPDASPDTDADPTADPRAHARPPADPQADTRNPRRSRVHPKPTPKPAKATPKPTPKPAKATAKPAKVARTPEADGHAQDRGRRVAEPVRRRRGRRLAQPDSDGRPPAAHGVPRGGCRRDQRLGQREAATTATASMLCSGSSTPPARSSPGSSPAPAGRCCSWFLMRRRKEEDEESGGSLALAAAAVAARGYDPRPPVHPPTVTTPPPAPRPAVATAKARPAKAESRTGRRTEGDTPRPRAPSPQLMASRTASAAPRSQSNRQAGRAARGCGRRGDRRRRLLGRLGPDPAKAQVLRWPPDVLEATRQGRRAAEVTTGVRVSEGLDEVNSASSADWTAATRSRSSALTRASFRSRRTA